MNYRSDLVPPGERTSTYEGALRSYNRAFLALYGLTPTEARRHSRGAPAARGAGSQVSVVSEGRAKKLVNI